MALPDLHQIFEEPIANRVTGYKGLDGMCMLIMIRTKRMMTKMNNCRRRTMETRDGNVGIIIKGVAVQLKRPSQAMLMPKQVIASPEDDTTTTMTEYMICYVHT